MVIIMKKQYYKKNKRKPHIMFSFFAIIIGMFISFKLLEHTKIKIKDTNIINIILNKTDFISSKDNTKLKLKFYIKQLSDNPNKLLLTTTSNLIEEQASKPVIKKEKQENENPKPLIYIYNTHQTEEYSPSTFLEYSLNPTVMMSDYILEETFNNNNFQTLVEENSIKDILNQNSWKYSSSYKASRILMEQRKKENDSLKYFIDVHRDSLKKDRTTVTINNKSYAKILFIIGLENPTYEENLKFTNEINDLLSQKYPNISKGIYKKQGAGVNGIYNQDFSPYTILIEMGGYENTTTEVLNSTLAFAECFMEVIKKYETKTTN